MDDKFTARSKPVAVTTEKQPVSKSSDTNMAVSSMEYNHKMDGQSNSVKMSMGSDVESGTVTSSAGRQGPLVSQPSLDISTPGLGQEIRSGIAPSKRKALENVYPATSSPVSQVIHVNAQKPKKGSFQITRVINRKQLDLDAVDHAEDADSIGDDFDETNTEDLSSEIMDTSKMTDIDQDPSSEDTVQSLAVEDLQREHKTVPASQSQTKDETVQDSTNSSATAVVNDVASQDGEITQTLPEGKENSDANFGPNRFRIVKVSNERFLKGRWTCHDYQDSERTIREKSNEDLGSGNSSAASSVHYVPGVDDPTKNPLSVTNVAYTENVSVPGLPAEAQPGQSVSQNQITNGDYNAQSMTTGLGNALAQISSEQQSAHELPSSIVQSVSAITQPISSQHSQQPAGTYTTSSVGASTGSAGGQTTSQLPTQDYNSTSQHQEYIAQQPPAQLPPQPTSQTIPQPQQPASKPPVAGGQEFSNGVPGSSGPADSSHGDISNTSLQPQGSSSLTDFATSTAKVPTSGAQSNTASPSDTIQTSDFRPSDSVYLPPADDQQSTVSVEDERVPESRLVKPLMVQSALTQPLLEMVQTMQHPLAGSRDPEDESGASTVAIDNKIEQAMDLVKSHLMFAVREEVLVLKDQIKELVEKNNQLEYENNVLRANATQETLSKLSPQTASQGQTQSSSS